MLMKRTFFTHHVKDIISFDITKLCLLLYMILMLMSDFVTVPECLLDLINMVKMT